MTVIRCQQKEKGENKGRTKARIFQAEGRARAKALSWVKLSVIWLEVENEYF